MNQIKGILHKGYFFILNDYAFYVRNKIDNLLKYKRTKNA